MTQNSIPALKALASLQQAASSEHHAVAAGHGMKVTHAKASVSFTVLSVNANQVALQDNANKQRFNLPANALVSGAMPKGGDTLVLVNASDRLLSFRLVPAPLPQRASQGQTAPLPMAYHRPLAESWPGINLSVMNKAPLSPSAMLTIDANDPAIKALARVLTQNAAKLGQPVIELPLAGNVVSVAQVPVKGSLQGSQQGSQQGSLQSTQRGMVQSVQLANQQGGQAATQLSAVALVKLSLAGALGSDMNISLPVSPKLAALMKTGTGIELIISPNRRGAAIQAVNITNGPSFSRTEVQAANAANPQLNQKIQPLSEALLFAASSKAAQQGRSPLSQSPVGSAAKSGPAQLFVQALQNGVLNALPNALSAQIKNALNPAQISEARLLISADKHSQNQSKVTSPAGQMTLMVVAKPQMVQIATQSIKADSTLSMLAGMDRSMLGVDGSSKHSANGLDSAGGKTLGNLGQQANLASSTQNIMKGITQGTINQGAAASIIQNPGLGAGLGAVQSTGQADGQNNNANALKNTIQNTATLLEQLKQRLPANELAALSPKILHALNHTLSHAEPSAPVINSIKSVLETIISTSGNSTRALLQPLLSQTLQQISAMLGESSASTSSSLSGSNLGDSAQLSGKLEAASIDIGDLLRSSMSAPAITQITQTSQGSPQNSFIEGLVSLLKLSLVAKLSASPHLQSAAKSAEIASNVAAFAANIIKQSNPKAERGAINRMVQDIARADPRGSLISDIGKLLSSHNTQKLRSAEATLQGQDTFYYSLPNIFNAEGDDIEIVIKRDKDASSQANNTALGSSWKLDMKLDVGQHGTVLAKTRFFTQSKAAPAKATEMCSHINSQSAKQGIDLHLYASSEDLKERVISHLPQLHKRLKSLGISVNTQTCNVGKVDVSLFKTQLNVMHTYA